MWIRRVMRVGRVMRIEQVGRWPGGGSAGRSVPGPVNGGPGPATAARPGSTSVISRVPLNRLISPVDRSRMWAMRGSASVPDDSASATAASAAPTSVGAWVSAAPTRAGRPGMAEMAPAATTAAEPPFKNTRRLTPLTVTSWAGGCFPRSTVPGRIRMMPAPNRSNPSRRRGPPGSVLVAGAGSPVGDAAPVGRLDLECRHARDGLDEADSGGGGDRGLGGAPVGGSGRGSRIDPIRLCRAPDDE